MSGWDVTARSTRGDGAWAVTGAAVVLATDASLIVGGGTESPGSYDVDTARIWDPATGASKPTGSMVGADRMTSLSQGELFAYGYPNAVLLSDGRVLVVHPQSAGLFELK